MKFSTVMMVAAFSMAVIASGCKYDKPADGFGEGLGAESGLAASQIATDSISAEELAAMSAVSEADALRDADVVDLDSAGGRHFEDYCTRCTDVDFAPVYFSFDSTVVPQTELGKVDSVAQHLSSNSDRVVVIEGNCDERGSNEYNLSLGENRATILCNYLVQSGIDASRIQTRSYGEEKPAVLGHDESAWTMNRRGEFAIYRKN